MFTPVNWMGLLCYLKESLNKKHTRIIGQNNIVKVIMILIIRKYAINILLKY